MKKGICQGSIQGATLCEKMQAAKRAGYDGMELTVGTVGELTFTSSTEDIEKIKSCAAQNGLEIYSISSAVCWDYTLTSDDKENRESAKQYIIKQLELANRLGCDTALVLAGSVGVDFLPQSPQIPYDVAYERALSGMLELKAYAEKYGVYMAIENVHNKLLLSPTEFKNFLEKIDSPYAGIYFDVGNVLVSGYPEQWIRILGDTIKKVHFKDYKMQTHDFVDLLEGDVNYPEVMKAFAEIGYDDWVTAEIAPYKYYDNAALYTTSAAMDVILGRI